MKTVFVSAGHSNVDPGATAPAVKDPRGKVIVPERREADIAVEFRNMVSFYLQRAGVPHELDGKGTENLPLSRAAARARSFDLAVEFHCNAASSPKASGCEALSGPKDTKLSAAICKALSEVFEIPNRGAKPENAGQHHRLAFVQSGGIIVELLFITSRSDLLAYDSRKWLAAKAVADVLIRASKA